MTIDEAIKYFQGEIDTAEGLLHLGQPFAITAETTICAAKIALAAIDIVRNTTPPYDPDYPGLKHKYNVYKAEDWSRVENCFVLRPDKDPAARMALLEYANQTDSKSLERDIRRWVQRSEVPKE